MPAGRSALRTASPRRSGLRDSGGLGDSGGPWGGAARSVISTRTGSSSATGTSPGRATSTRVVGASTEIRVTGAASAGADPGGTSAGAEVEPVSPTGARARPGGVPGRCRCSSTPPPGDPFLRAWSSRPRPGRPARIVPDRLIRSLVWPAGAPAPGRTLEIRCAGVAGQTVPAPSGRRGVGTQVVRRGPRPAAPVMPAGEIPLEAPPAEPRVAPAGLLARLLPLVMLLASVGFVVVIGIDNPTSWLFGGMIALSTHRHGRRRLLPRRRPAPRRVRRRARRLPALPRPDPPAGPDGRGRAAREPGVDPPRPGRARHARPRPADVGAPPRRRRLRARPRRARCPAARDARSSRRRPARSRTSSRSRRWRCAASSAPTPSSRPCPPRSRCAPFAAVGITGTADRRAPSRAGPGPRRPSSSPSTAPTTCCSPWPPAARGGSAWEWCKWLPHVAHPRLADGAGPMRMIASSLATVQAWLAPELADRPRFTRGAAAAGGRGPRRRGARRGGRRRPRRATTTATARSSRTGSPGSPCIDVDGIAVDGLVARRGLRLVVSEDPAGGHRIGAGSGARPAGSSGSGARTGSPAPRPRRWPGGSRPAAPPGAVARRGRTVDAGPARAARRRRRPGHLRRRRRLAAPRGARPAARAVRDRRGRRAGRARPQGGRAGGHGPARAVCRRDGLGQVRAAAHAWCSAWSPRTPRRRSTWCSSTSRAAPRSPGLAAAPHVAAVITNLADDLGLVDRMQDALAGEMNRRQELLRAAGNLASVADYERARERGADLEPLPALFVVVDEFSELLHQKPDLADLFTAIGRLGRSLQIHLLLASQRLDEGRLRGLDSHLSYRIGLRDVLRRGLPRGARRAGRRVAALGARRRLPAQRHLHDGALHRGLRLRAPPPRSAAAGGAADRRPDRHPPAAPVPRRLGRPAARAGAPVPTSPGRTAPRSRTTDTTVPSVLDAVVERLREAGPARARGVAAAAGGPDGARGAPPAAARHPRPRPVRARLPGERVAAPPARAGRPALRAASGPALGRPRRGGGARRGGGRAAVGQVDDAARAGHRGRAHPHPGRARLPGRRPRGRHARRPRRRCRTSGPSPDAATPTWCAAWSPRSPPSSPGGSAGSASTASPRPPTCAPGAVAGSGSPSTTGSATSCWSSTAGTRSATDHEALEPTIISLATAGLSYGVHVAIAVSRWAELRPALKDLLGTRVELRLGDPGESEVDRRVAATVPPGRPGRGLAPDRHHVLVARPGSDDDAARGGGRLARPDGAAGAAAARAGRRHRAARPGGGRAAPAADRGGRGPARPGPARRLRRPAPAWSTPTASPGRPRCCGCSPTRSSPATPRSRPGS